MPKRTRLKRKTFPYSNVRRLSSLRNRLEWSKSHPPTLKEQNEGMTFKDWDAEIEDLEEQIREEKTKISMIIKTDWKLSKKR